MFKKSTIKFHKGHNIEFYQNPGKMIFRKLEFNGKKEYVWMTPIQSMEFNKNQRIKNNEKN